ncbi:zinc finger HIT domain-containing protein 2-like [Dysidea avara]|uniref:zinc finger HIT domain-containing protein 2-like n=1 Tax=Dysidea avara TaxID=196820 RepID=UPI0033344F81
MVQEIHRGNSIFKLKMSVQLEYFVIDVCSIRVDMCSNVTSSEFKTIADNSCDDNTTENLEERLHGLDLDVDSELVWQQLTDTEKEEFHKMLGDGRIGHLLDTYTPWWKHQHSRVVEVSASDDLLAPIYPYPAIPANLPALNTLLKVQPSSLLKYNVVNVLYSYAYIIRLFNGSHTELIQQAVEGLLNLSSVLSHNAVFHDCNSAIKDSITNSQQHKDTATSLEFAYAVMLDVSCIITNGSHDLIGRSQCLVSHVLSDLHHMIQSSCTKAKGSKKSGTKGVTSTKMLREVERKVFFLLVWSKEHYSDLLPLQKVIEIEHEGLVKELKEHRGMELKIQEKQITSKTSQNTPQHNSRLIEEL